MAKERKEFTGYWGQKRLSASLPYKWDRQGIHAVAGLLVTLGAACSTLAGMPPVFAAGFYVAITYGFVAYETTEDEDISDWGMARHRGLVEGLGDRVRSRHWRHLVVGIGACYDPGRADCGERG